MGPAATDTMEHNLADLLPPATCWAFGATEDLVRSVAEWFMKEQRKPYTQSSNTQQSKPNAEEIKGFFLERYRKSS